MFPSQIVINRLNFVCSGLWHSANYLCKNIFPKTYPLARVHSWQTTTDRQTYRRRQPYHKLDHYLRSAKNRKIWSRDLDLWSMELEIQ